MVDKVYPKYSFPQMNNYASSSLSIFRNKIVTSKELSHDTIKVFVALDLGEFYSKKLTFLLRLLNFVTP